MKTLYTLVRDRLEDVAPKDLIVDNEISKQLADFQKVAVKHAIQNKISDPRSGSLRDRQKSELKSQPIAAIVCSEGLVYCI